jgi:hypothetical protein
MKIKPVTKNLETSEWNFGIEKFISKGDFRGLI